MFTFCLPSFHKVNGELVAPTNARGDVCTTHVPVSSDWLYLELEAKN